MKSRFPETEIPSFNACSQKENIAQWFGEYYHISFMLKE